VGWRSSRAGVLAPRGADRRGPSRGSAPAETKPQPPQVIGSPPPARGWLRGAEARPRDMAATKAHPGALATGAPGPAPDSKQVRKERVLLALTRLNDKDTQRAAVEELFGIVRVRASHSARPRRRCQAAGARACRDTERNGSKTPAAPPRPQDLDNDSLPAVVSCLCSTGADQKPFARKVGRAWLILRSSPAARRRRRRRRRRRPPNAMAPHRAGVHPRAGAARQRRVRGLAGGAAAPLQQDTGAGPARHAGGRPAWPPGGRGTLPLQQPAPASAAGAQDPALLLCAAPRMPAQALPLPQPQPQPPRRAHPARPPRCRRTRTAA
jgi:hypothetical protein